MKDYIVYIPPHRSLSKEEQRVVEELIWAYWIARNRMEEAIAEAEEWEPPTTSPFRSEKESGEPMTEEKLFQTMMISLACLAGLCGLGAVGLLILCAASFSFGVLVCAILLAVGTGISAYYAAAFASRAQAPKVFNNQDEKEVLTNQQRKELKKARGEVVMERAMIEIQHERENIVHKLELDAADPDKPPHETRWSEDVRRGVRNAITSKRQEHPL